MISREMLARSLHNIVHESDTVRKLFSHQMVILHLPYAQCCARSCGKYKKLTIHNSYFQEIEAKWNIRQTLKMELNHISLINDLQQDWIRVLHERRRQKKLQRDLCSAGVRKSYLGRDRRQRHNWLKSWKRQELNDKLCLRSKDIKNWVKGKIR